MMEEIIVEDLFTDLEALKQMKAGSRASVPVRIDSGMFAIPVRCRLIANTDGSEGMALKSFVAKILEPFKDKDPGAMSADELRLYSTSLAGAVRTLLKRLK